MRCHVRHGELYDIPRIIDLAEKFWIASGYDRQGRFCPEDTGQTAAMLVQGGGIVLLAETMDRVVGMALLLVGPALCNHGVRNAHEIAWYVEPDYLNTGAGIKLFRSIEPEARRLGCRAIQMFLLAGSPAHAENLYRRDGYQPTERGFTKYLEN